MNPDVFDNLDRNILIKLVTTETSLDPDVNEYVLAKYVANKRKQFFSILFVNQVTFPLHVASH
jgi:predicted transport protein